MEEYLSAVERYGITDLVMVPPIVIAILMSPLSRTHPFLKGVRVAACGAAPLDKDLQARFRSLMGGAPFNQVWGMTETTCVATMFPFPEHDDTGSVGRLIPNLEAKYVQPTPPPGNRILTNSKAYRQRRKQHLSLRSSRRALCPGPDGHPRI